MTFALNEIAGAGAEILSACRYPGLECGLSATMELQNRRHWFDEC